ncbi:MAG: 4-hydroxythreonine-4-phosphate dehydrogenase [Gammaproteobacteria bacterium]|nr:MAG: 4-hydroxythreonine-4-phosphate dehydrogenase [Gammaproteobacteria bacterium]
MKTIIYSPGDPAGIGPDLFLSLLNEDFFRFIKANVVCIGDQKLFASRAKELGYSFEISTITDINYVNEKVGCLEIMKCPDISSGRLNSINSEYVIKNLDFGIDSCMKSKGLGLVTGPISKENIVEGGYSFSGHTERIMEKTNSDDVLMLLASERLKVALATTHMPLNKVSESITTDLIINKVKILNQELKSKFNIEKPKISLLGLNPHAGEGGKLGKEEIEIIIPAVKELIASNVDVSMPLSADTAFNKNLLDKLMHILLCIMTKDFQC